MTGSDSTSAQVSWGLIVPDDWWRIPLQDPVARTRALRTLVDTQFGKADAAASVRRKVRADVQGLASRAAAAGGVYMAISTTLFEKMPLAITMVVYELPALRTSSDEVELGDELEELARRGSREDASLSRAQIDAGLVIRSVWASEVVRPEPGATSATPPELRAEYWLAPKRHDAVVYIVFTCPWVTLADDVVGLFDSVVESFHGAPVLAERSHTRDEGS